MKAMYEENLPPLPQGIRLDAERDMYIISDINDFLKKSVKYDANSVKVKEVIYTEDTQDDGCNDVAVAIIKSGGKTKKVEICSIYSMDYIFYWIGDNPFDFSVKRIIE